MNVKQKKRFIAGAESCPSCSTQDTLPLVELKENNIELVEYVDCDLPTKANRKL